MAWRTFGEALVVFVVILDPLGNVPLFLTLTGAMSKRQRVRAAYVAVLVAGAVMAGFAVFGQALIDYLGISLQSLMVAGALLLLIVALEMLRGVTAPLVGPEEVSVALVPLATPFLAGPGTIVATMVLLQRHHPAIERLAIVGAGVVALGTVLLALRFASALAHLVRPSAIHFLTRIMGLLLTAIAVQLVVDAVAEWMRSGLR